MAAETVMETEVNGVRLPCVEQGSGDNPWSSCMELITDLRAWLPIKDEIAKTYRFIAYTQRYFGTSPWNDEGEQFSVATLSDDLAKFVVSLNA